MPRLIDPTSDRPIYRQIADHLRAGIREGRYPEGTPLPSESQLAEMYDVTRMTARQAVDVLKNEGLVRSEHGRGVFVRQRPTVHRLARNRFTRQRRETGKGAYDVEMKELGFTPGVELVEVGPVTPPDEIVKRLQLEPGEQALIRRRRMYANGEPMQLATSYLPWSLAEGTPMAERDTGPGGIYSRLADIGHGPIRFTEDVSTPHAHARGSRVPTTHSAPASVLPDPHRLRRQRSPSRDLRAHHVRRSLAAQLRMGSRLKLMLVRSFSTTSRPALRAAAYGGHPRAGNDTRSS
jgi:GntR family transcriptional regulator